MLETPPGFVAVEIGKGCTLVIPSRVFEAGLKLGKVLRRRSAAARRTAKEAPRGPGSRAVTTTG
jgi:hypothetical protein